jgi:protocatechuate 3,4-dioxygenase beta subunit
MTISKDRRRIVTLLGAAMLAPLAATPALGQDLAPTPRSTEGPFYPQSVPADSDADLTRVAGRADHARGTPLEVSGRVLDRNGRPRAGARVEIWQCDAGGRYHHVGENDAALDPGFQGFGAVIADAEGRYRFRTIKPVPYPGRTPHIHFTVVEGSKRRLTSQMYIEGEPGNARDGLYRSLGRDAERVTMKLGQAAGALQGALDIVLA